jgi:hypothetical protein
MILQLFDGIRHQMRHHLKECKFARSSLQKLLLHGCQAYKFCLVVIIWILFERNREHFSQN